MPNWTTHNYWCRRLGVSTRICKSVNGIIDNPKLFGHDWIRGNKGVFITDIIVFYNISGVDSIKTMILCGVLDYMYTLVTMMFPRDYILWRAMAWIRFCGAKHMIRNIRRKFMDDKNE